MLKDIHNYNARAVAAGLLLALMTGTAFAQLLPTAPALGQRDGLLQGQGRCCFNLLYAVGALPKSWCRRQ